VLPLVSATVFLPLLGAIVLVLLPRVPPRAAHAVGLGVAGLTLLGALLLAARGTGTTFDQVEEIGWIPSLGSAYASGWMGSTCRSSC
jgi:NADH-quinone oxidoreductase subunit M